MRNVCVEVACFHVYLHVLALCSLWFSPHFSLSDPASCYSSGHFSVFTCQCKNSSMYNNLQCLPPAPHLLEILGLSEFTVTVHLPQKHKYKKRTTVCVKNNFYDNISPSAASPLAMGSAGPGPDHNVLMYSINKSVVSPSCYSPPILAQWLEESVHRLLAP